MSLKTGTRVWYVYILRCNDNSLYTGITTHLARRLKEHNSINSKTRYTRPRQPVMLVYYETYANRSEASQREYAIKQMSKLEKEALLKNAPLTKSQTDSLGD